MDASIATPSSGNGTSHGISQPSVNLRPSQKLSKAITALAVIKDQMRTLVINDYIDTALYRPAPDQAGTVRQEQVVKAHADARREWSETVNQLSPPEQFRTVTKTIRLVGTALQEASSNHTGVQGLQLHPAGAMRSHGAIDYLLSRLETLTPKIEPRDANDAIMSLVGAVSSQSKGKNPELRRLGKQIVAKTIDLLLPLAAACPTPSHGTTAALIRTIDAMKGFASGKRDDALIANASDAVTAFAERIPDRLERTQALMEIGSRNSKYATVVHCIAPDAIEEAGRRIGALNEALGQGIAPRHRMTLRS